MLNIYYINLDNATKRRESINENLAIFKSDNVAIHRITAIDKKYIEENNVAGGIRSNEKGCFLSHIKAIEASLKNPGYALILEDDILLGSQSIALLNRLLVPAINDIDLLFLELCISNLPSMFQLYQLKKELARGDKVEILRTKLFDFAGSSAYILNDRSKLKLLEALRQIRSFDVPYDLVLKSLIAEDRLSSGFIFPFIATLSDESLNTSIQLDSDALPNIVYDAFRKLMFIDADYSKLNSLDAIPEEFYGEDDLAFGRIVSTVMSENFPLRLF
jgi:GR25 family glycosyltransferase involved in LPS biosynthesis